MIRDRDWRARRVVGNEADLGTAIMKLGDACYGTRDRDRTQIDDSIKIEQHGVIGIDDGRGYAHL
jgi:hypothetical protein